MKIIVSNIQRFSLHDGPGIRTTIFLKGCNLRCPWCCNPENINFNVEQYNTNNMKGTYGKLYTLEELYNEIIKDFDFYDSKGGVTFSGGECLWQFKKIEPLLKKLKEENINICIETALNVPIEFVKIALKYVEEFYIDMKIVNKNEEHLIGSNLELYLNNLDLVLSKNKNTTIRIPLVPEYTYTDSNIESICDILKNRKINKVELFKIHRFGEKKYESLGLKMPDFKSLSNIDIEKVKLKFSEYVKNVEIIKI